MHDVIISDREKDKEHVDDCKNDPHMDFINEDVHSNSSERRREMRKKVDLIYVRINFFLATVVAVHP